MKTKNRITNLSLARRIWISIALVSLIPLIVLLYYLFGYQISFFAATTLLLVVILGWRVVFEVFSSIIRLYTQSKTALEDIGEQAPEISDEVQSLETVINVLSDKVKSGFEELKDFTQKTEELNREVTKKVLVLSAILQANDLFSKDAPAEEIIKFLSEHLKKILETNVCFCSLKDDAQSKLKPISFLGVEIPIIDSFIENRNSDLPQRMKLSVVDSSNKPKPYLGWAKELGLVNMALVPVVAKGIVVGIVGVGNNQDEYNFSKDEIDVLNLFSQNVTLIWEHRRLSSKIEDLEVLDDLTDLYNEKVIIRRLDEEIRRSSIYQRPCGFISVSLLDPDKYQKEFGLIESEKILKKIAHGFKRSLRPIDIAGRIGPQTLGAIIIESNKRHSQEAAKKAEAALKVITQGKVKLSFSVAASPLDGTTAKELIKFTKLKKNKQDN
ncbi:MAG: diguanylate cyclase [Candidatus Omnitrophica bacterium]|nr:diguanylate cyclase [Candidatus Omnitrophota bacterium]